MGNKNYVAGDATNIWGSSKLIGGHLNRIDGT